MKMNLLIIPEKKGPNGYPRMTVQTIGYRDTFTAMGLDENHGTFADHPDPNYATLIALSNLIKMNKEDRDQTSDEE